MNMIRIVTKEMIEKRATALTDKFIEEHPRTEPSECRRKWILKYVRTKALMDVLESMGFNIKKKIWLLKGKPCVWSLLCGVSV